MDNNQVEYLALGSIVILKGAVEKIMIVSRGMVCKLEGGPRFFEYGGCYYPQGIVSEQIMYFNHEDILKIVFEGYRDESDGIMLENIKTWFEESDYEKGNVRDLLGLRNQ